MRNAGLESSLWSTGWNQDCQEKYQYADDTTLMAESEEELKSLVMKVEEESEKVGLKLSIQKIKITASGLLFILYKSSEKRLPVTYGIVP